MFSEAPFKVAVLNKNRCAFLRFTKRAWPTSRGVSVHADTLTILVPTGLKDTLFPELWQKTICNPRLAGTLYC